MKFSSLLLRTGFFLALGVVPVRAQLLSIQNDSLRVSYDPATERFSISNIVSGRTFVTAGWFYASGGSATAGPVTDDRFGTGQRIDIVRPNGNRDAILLFPSLPFALFQTTLANDTAAAVVTNKVRTVSVQVDLAKPVTNLMTLGTGGLLKPGSPNSGSYVWFAVADPQSRNGVVSGWITDDRGSGVIFPSVQSGVQQLDARVDYGHLRLAPGATTPLEMFAVGYFDDARLGLETWADTVARVYQIHLPPQPVGYCTWYSNPNGGCSDEVHLAEWADCAVTNLVPFGFTFMQIDDHWQAGISTNGPKRDFTTNNPVFYPHGMKAAADDVKSKGLTPGLWFLPFSGTYYDGIFTNHLDWFVKTTNGEPYKTPWGGTCLDMTYGPARDYVSNVVSRIAHDWGYDYFKLDALSTGAGVTPQYPNSFYREDNMGDGILSNPDKSNIEAFRDGLKLVRQAAGPGVFILGCNTPQNMRSYGGAFGLVDAMRIGPDNGASWSSLLRGPTYGSRHYFLHGRIWYNDPDPLYVRPTVPLNQSQAICSWVTISGQLNANSEWLPELPADRLDLLKRTMPGHGLLPRPVDLFENDPPRIWLLTDTRRTPRRDVIALFNWSTNASRTFDVPLGRIGLPGTNYVGFEFWSNALVPALNGSLQATVPPQSCQVIAIRPAGTVPQLISTSRHITQGIVDVLSENWDGTNTLSGTSQIVGGDPCELRIYSPGGWRVQTARISADDEAAGVVALFHQTNGLTRVLIQSPTSRTVAWSAGFVQAPAPPSRLKVQ